VNGCTSLNHDDEHRGDEHRGDTEVVLGALKPPLARGLRSRLSRGFDVADAWAPVGPYACGLVLVRGEPNVTVDSEMGFVDVSLQYGDFTSSLRDATIVWALFVGADGRARWSSVARDLASR